MTDIQKWKTLNSQWVLNNQWCQVRQDKVQLQNGTIIDDFFVNVRPDIVIILGLTPQKDIIFVRQYRHGSGQILLELPAGRCDSNQEPIEEAAMREFREETGYDSQQWISLGSIYENPIKDTQQIHLFLALDAVKTGEQQLDITEEIEVVLIPFDQVESRIFNGEICVAGTISTIYLGLNYLANL
ncbi:MAG: NUDIX hydrolase, partial [Microcystaceae cyanobacterium]